MKQPNEIRQALIDGTVRVVAHNGLDKATTKALALEAGVNEVNIYRMFDSKEDLLKKTFSSLDNELVSFILQYLPIMDMTEIPIEGRCRALFFFVWKFITGNREKCLYFIRYYYSPYFEKYSFEEHEAAYHIVVEKFAPVFQQGADVCMLLNHIMDAMLSSAVKVFQNEMPDSDETAVQVYRLIYSVIEPQLAWSRANVS